jgi:hypothetical protein
MNDVHDKPAVRPDWQKCPLFCIHNGYMLGVFTQLMAFRFARDRFEVLRGRVVEFLNEVELDIAIAHDHETFVEKSAELFENLRRETEGASKLLSAYYYVGSSAAALASGFATDSSDREHVKDAMSHLLETSPIEKNPLPRFLESVKAGEEAQPERRSVNAVVSLCLNLITEVIRQLPVGFGGHSCFVAMPFRDPYLGYYPTFFTTLAHELNCVPIRAWGGLAAEIYVDLLYQLIRQSETVIADVSDANLNVIHEVGLAHGMGKEVHMLRRSDRPREVSNLMGIFVFEYSSEGESWGELEVSRYLAARSMLRFSLALSASDAPRDPEAFLEWRREHGGLEFPAREPGEPPFITILPSFSDEEGDQETEL